MQKPEHQETIQHAVAETADSFHVQATLLDNRTVAVPVSYQIAEPGFRPFLDGKGSAEDLQAEYDLEVARAADHGVELGLDSEESVSKLLVQMGIGIDCSNFVYRCLKRIHNDLQLPDYDEYVFRSTKDVLAQIDKGRWIPGSSSYPRKLSDTERSVLSIQTHVPAAWIQSVLGKDPVRVIGSRHISDDRAAVQVAPDELRSGDLISLRARESEHVSHVAIIDTVEHNPREAVATFWHSFHSRGFNSGLRHDRAVFNTNGTSTWSIPSLDSRRYTSFALHRPIGLQN